MHKQSVIFNHFRTSIVQNTADDDLAVLGVVLCTLPDAAEFKCYTLEDAELPVGTKVMHNTALPATLYNMEVNFSPKFEKQMVMLSNNSDHYCSLFGVTFTGARVHAGVKPDHTSGCVLTGTNVDTVKGIIWTPPDFINPADELVSIVTTLIDVGYEPLWNISSIYTNLYPLRNVLPLPNPLSSN